MNALDFIYERVVKNCVSTNRLFIKPEAISHEQWVFYTKNVGIHKKYDIWLEVDDFETIIPNFFPYVVIPMDVLPKVKLNPGYSIEDVLNHWEEIKNEIL